MSKDIKNLDEGLEVDNLTRPELIKAIDTLKEEIEQLKEEKKEYLGREAKTFKFLEKLSRKKEKYLNQSLKMVKIVENLTKSTIADRNQLTDEFEAEKEKLTNENVKHVKTMNKLHLIVKGLTHTIEEIKSNTKISDDSMSSEIAGKINELEEQVEQLKHTISDKEQPIVPEDEMLISLYEDKIKKLEAKLENSEISADDGEIASKYETTIRKLEDDIQNLSTSHQEEMTNLKAENEKFKERIKELQKQIQRAQRAPAVQERVIEEEPSPIEHVSVDTKSAVFQPGEMELEYAQEYATELTSEEGETTPLGIADTSRRCPRCGNQKKALIREQIDKTNIIVAYPRMYGKKFCCGAYGCGAEWRVKEGKVEIIK